VTSNRSKVGTTPAAAALRRRIVADRRRLHDYGGVLHMSLSSVAQRRGTDLAADAATIERFRWSVADGRQKLKVLTGGSPCSVSRSPTRKAFLASFVRRPFAVRRQRCRFSWRDATHAADAGERRLVGDRVDKMMAPRCIVSGSQPVLPPCGQPPNRRSAI
jgi:hypothetical protein